MSDNIAKEQDRTVYPVSPVPAVAVMVMRGDEILMIERGKEPRKGTWTVPGGSIELGETMAMAARREVMEETGVSIEPGAAFTAIDAIYTDSRGGLKFHYIIIYIEARYLKGTPKASDDAADVRWVRTDTIRKGFSHAEPGTLRIIRKRLGLD